jgi:hypothetical protein
VPDVAPRGPAADDPPDDNAAAPPHALPSSQSLSISPGPDSSPGLSWSWELDIEELMAALGTPADADVDDPADQDAVPDAAAGGRRLAPEELAGRVAEYLPVGPGLAGWLGSAPAASLQDSALAGMAASWRRLASWAQAGELAVIAQIASRAASCDDKIAVAADGRPAQVPADAASEVALALAMSQFGASGWTDLAVTLTWRLAATGAALRAGEIDLQRARLIAEATGLLDDDAARAVEARILPNAGFQTSGHLRATLRRAVIAVDPEGAERRRKEAERRAKVCLYPDEEGTATLAGQSLPGIRAAAAMARVKALARAMIASGAEGGIDLVGAQVFIGLLLGTLPFIPPAEGSPPDEPPGGQGPYDPGPDGPGPDDHGPDDDGPDDDGPDDHGPDGAGERDPAGWAADDHLPSDPSRYEPQDDSDPGPGAGAAGAGAAGAGAGAGEFSPGEDEDGDWLGQLPVPVWPALPAFLPPAPDLLGPVRPQPDGMLDLTMPWTTLAGISPEPGQLGRLGPIDPSEARQLADLASANPSAEWRVIVTSPQGIALAVTRIRRRKGSGSVRDGPPGDAGLSRAVPVSDVGLVSRVTLTVPSDLLDDQTIAEREHLRADWRCVPLLAAALRAAERAAGRAAVSAKADEAAGGCAHTAESAAYQPPPRIKEYVAARDQTCRFPPCRQPAWRGDLDHTIPHDAGGRTCHCNLGGVCRTHHRLKRHLRWRLVQAAPGTFIWTTATGRTYTTGPDIHSI